MFLRLFDMSTASNCSSKCSMGNSAEASSCVKEIIVKSTLPDHDVGFVTRVLNGEHRVPEAWQGRPRYL